MFATVRGTTVAAQDLARELASLAKIQLAHQGTTGATRLAQEQLLRRVCLVRPVQLAGIKPTVPELIQVPAQLAQGTTRLPGTI